MTILYYMESAQKQQEAKTFKDKNYSYSGVKYSKKNRNRNRSSKKKKGKKSSKRRTTMNNKKGKKLSKSFYGVYNGGGTDDFDCKEIKSKLEINTDFNPNIEESWVKNMPNFCQSSFYPDYKNVSGTRDCNKICTIIDTKYIGGDYKEIDSSSKCSCLLGKEQLNITPRTRRNKKKPNLSYLHRELAKKATPRPLHW